MDRSIPTKSRDKEIHSNTEVARPQGKVRPKSKKEAKPTIR